MGYELKMRVGWLASKSPEFKDGPLTLSEDGSEAYRPALKDANGEYIKTGRTEQTFIEVAKVDLCKIYDTETSKVATAAFVPKSKRATTKNVIKWYNGNEEHTEDAYGDMPTAVPLKRVITALRKDVKVLDFNNGTQPYRRFVWALALLEAVAKTDDGNKKEFIVIFEGH